MDLSPEERSLRARLAALEMHARGSTNTAPAREALRRKFEDQVDPNRELPEAERKKRADAARRAHYTRLALRSVVARRQARERREEAERLDAIAEQLEAQRRETD